MTGALFKTETLSEISRDIGQVLFAALFIEPIAQGNVNVRLIIVGIMLSGAAWVISLLITKS